MKRENFPNNHKHKVQITRVFDNVKKVWVYSIKNCKFEGQPNSSYTPGSCLDGHNVIIRPD